MRLRALISDSAAEEETRTVSKVSAEKFAPISELLIYETLLPVGNNKKHILKVEF